MKQKNRIIIYPILVMGFVLILANSCKKDETTASKNNPIITWVNPLDINYGTLLSATQLNATANVPGIFVYTPAVGTKLNVGNNQDLIVDFTPTDTATYYTVSKTVRINVTLPPNSVTDIDGNVYNTVTIGTQVWMAENLRTTKYNDNTAIPNITDTTAWKALTTPAYCWYNNDASTYKANYGALYNWYTVNTGKLAPKGWHVPTDAEWTTLTTYLGGAAVAGGKLKETGTVHWIDNMYATNETGFTALPGGLRWEDGLFYNVGVIGKWWSATEFLTNNAWYRQMYSKDSDVERYGYFKRPGFSVRCVKD
jgi:uncharacterized protein (TIGR02145 family)